MAELAASVQEGSRWLHAKPSADEFSGWVENNVAWHEEMDKKRYISGITLIEGKEKYRETRVDSSGEMQIVDDLERLAYTPYATVSARILYFWDWIGKNEDLLGVIEPVKQTEIADGPFRNANLPPGFFIMPVNDSANKTSYYLGCTQRVRVYKRESVVRSRHSIDEFSGEAVLAPAPASKIVPLVERWGPDENSIMKAESGAVGRALGMAGILVIPGTGVASAEDMQELGTRAVPSGEVPADADVPGDQAASAVADETKAVDPRARIIELVTKVEQEKPEAFEAFKLWLEEKNIKLEDVKSGEVADTQLRGVLRQLEKALDA